MTKQEQASDGPTAAPRAPWRQQMYVYVIVATVAGAVLGAVDPTLGAALRPLGDGFIALIKMMIAPVIFCTIVHGIGSMQDLGRVGRIGLKTIAYFELISTFALALGLLAAHLTQPGAGLAQQTSAAGAKAVAGFVGQAQSQDWTQHLLAIVPVSYFDAFAKGDLLQVLLVSILTGVALSQMGSFGQDLAGRIEGWGQVFFRIIGIVVKAAPVGAFGAMAYTVGAFGTKALVSLGWLVLVFYATSILFVVAVLGLVAWLCGFSIFRFLAYFRDELLIVVGTSSSETVLPSVMRKLKRLGLAETTVGLVVPTGYSFNLDGTNIYMTLSILFLAQMTGTHLSWTQEATIIAIAMLTSKGASGVTGAGFVTLAATLAIVPDIPIVSLGVLLGVDRFMSLGRALTNLVGNCVGTAVIGRWEKDLTAAELRQALAAG